MNIFSKFFNNTKNLNLYEIALNEFESGEMVKGVYAKAIALSEGDESKIKSVYLTLRAEQLNDEENKVTEETKTKIKKSNSRFRKFLIIFAIFTIGSMLLLYSGLF